MRGREAFESTGRSWPCGTPEQATDPGLMLGEAGIGYHYLRLASPETPSVLLPRLALTPPSAQATAGVEQLREQHVASYFGRTLAILHLLHLELPPVAAEHAEAQRSAASDVTACFDSIQRRIAGESSVSLRSLIEDAFRLERERYELTWEIGDFTEELLGDLQRPEGVEIRWQETPVRLSRWASVVEVAWDWDEWLASPESDRPTRPNAGPVHFLLYRTGNQVHIRRLSWFAAAVLGSLRTPALVDRIAAQVEALMTSSNDRAALAQRIVEQLQHAYRVHVVELASQ